MRRIAFAVASILGLMIPPALVWADGPTTAPAIYATPADVFAASEKAARAGDCETYVDCQSPDNQEIFVKLFVQIAMATPTTNPNPSDQDKQILAFMAKYGLDHHDRLAGEADYQWTDRVAALIKDKPAFLKDLMSQNPPDPNPGPMPELTDLQIQADGVTATAKAVVHTPDGTAGSQDVKFKKIDGSWRLDSLVVN